mmetsp:Transcript_162449/g.516100  ORF Transcript_162449/g.516100 Transcript_162449/m.516100 type:complete len:207 (+) Transcript_162449:299-919(+)
MSGLLPTPTRRCRSCQPTTPLQVETFWSSSDRPTVTELEECTGRQRCTARRRMCMRPTSSDKRTPSNTSPNPAGSCHPHSRGPSDTPYCHPGKPVNKRPTPRRRPAPRARPRGSAAGPSSCRSRIPAPSRRGGTRALRMSRSLCNPRRPWRPMEQRSTIQSLVSARSCMCNCPSPGPPQHRPGPPAPPGPWARRRHARAGRERGPA